MRHEEGESRRGRGRKRVKEEQEYPGGKIGGGDAEMVSRKTVNKRGETWPQKKTSGKPDERQNKEKKIGGGGGKRNLKVGVKKTPTKTKNARAPGPGEAPRETMVVDRLGRRGNEKREENR